MTRAVLLSKKVQVSKSATLIVEGHDQADSIFIFSAILAYLARHYGKHLSARSVGRKVGIVH